MKYYIKTFGCAGNIADSERITGQLNQQRYKEVSKMEEADLIVINTCVVRKSAEDRFYSLKRRFQKLKEKNPRIKIIITGCIVGVANREESGQLIKKIKRVLPQVDELWPIDKFDFNITAKRKNKNHALVPISNGCNNMCSYCIVPLARGREISRPFADIIEEVKQLANENYQEITLIGQNVNSYGADLVKSSPLPERGLRGVGEYKLPNGKEMEPVMVKHLGKTRIPTLFPYLLEEVCKIDGIKKVDFMSANPWDFSDELIDIIAQYPKINREIHLPFQSGDDKILKNMNRFYTKQEYINLIKKIKAKIPKATFTTDIIVGFPSETETQFQETIDLCQKINFNIAFIGKYSPRPGTISAEKYEDNIPSQEKNRRFHILNQLINKKISKIR